MGKQSKQQPADLQAEVASGVGDAWRRAMLSTERRHQHKGTDEQVQILRAEIGRLRKRVKKAEDQLAEHRHSGTDTPVRYGVHIDGRGGYWMRRPDGWHPMAVSQHPIAAESVPRTAYRLREDKRRPD